MIWAQEVIQRSFGDQSDVASRHFFHVVQAALSLVAHFIVASPKAPYYALSDGILDIALTFYH
jgi:hypothetical protein